MSKTKNKFNPRYDNVPNIRFSLRLTESIQEEVWKYSQKCNISMNSMILKCIEYALDNKEDL